MTTKLPDIYISRKAEIVDQFKQVLDDHLNDLVAGRVDRMYELNEIANKICLHPVHLSKIIKLETGYHACHFYQQKIMTEAKKMLATTLLPINLIAYKLDYDVSNFTKSFKKFVGVTPSVYRKSMAKVVQ